MSFCNLFLSIRPLVLAISTALFFLFSSPLGAENCGQVIAQSQGHELTDVVLNHRLKDISTDTIGLWRELKKTNAQNENEIHQLLTSTAAEIIAERLIAQSDDARTTEVAQLDEAAKSLIRTDVITIAFQDYLKENFQTDELAIEEEARKNIKQIADTIEEKETSSDKPIQIRTIFRRFNQGDETAKSEQKALLEKVRSQLLSNELKAEEAVFQYSQAPSASRKGLVEALPRLQYPYFIQKALQGLQENEWSDVIETKSNMIMIQYIGLKKIDPPTLQGEIDRLTQRKRLEFSKSLLADYAKNNATENEAKEAFLKAQNIDLTSIISCLIEHDSTKHVAEQVFLLRAKKELSQKTEQERRELFEHNKIPFRRMWSLNRFEYRLERNPNMERESSEYSFSEIKDYWIEKIVPELSNFEAGTYKEAPIPQGWQLEVKPISISYPIKPSVDTPRPVSNPSWKNYTLFSESLATITPFGNPEFQDEEFLRFEEVSKEQFEALMSLELAGILRKQLIDQVSQELTTKF